MQVGAKFNLKTWRSHANEKAVVAFDSLAVRGPCQARENWEWLKERAENGVFQTVIKLSLQDTSAFQEIMRMSPDQFKEILNASVPDICKQSTKIGGELIVPVKRRALRLRFLATGESFRSLNFNLRSADLQYLIL